MKKALILLIMPVLFITGCSHNSSYETYMEEGKKSVEDSDYDEAKDFFDLALKEKKTKEADALYQETQSLIDAVKLKEEGKPEEAIKAFAKIDKIESETDLVKAKASKIRTDLEKEIETFKGKKDDISKYIDDAEKLISEEKYNEAKDFINETKNKIEKEDGLKDQLNKIKELVDTCNEKTEQ